MNDYHIDLSFNEVKRGIYNPLVFDKENIPMYPIKNKYYYHITLIAHYALYQLHLFLKLDKKKYKDKFLYIADWISRNGIETENGKKYNYMFDFFGLKAPWISALGQGYVLSVLSRAYNLTKDEKYRIDCEKIIIPFTINSKNGGVKTKFPNGEVAYEEYPKKNSNIALNGFIFSLFGLYDCAKYCNNNLAKELFNKGVISLKNNLQYFDSGYWSSYSYSRRILPTRVTYHRLHCAQLWGLYEITNIEIFKEYSIKWDKYSNNPLYLAIVNFMALIKDIKYKILKKNL